MNCREAAVTDAKRNCIVICEEVVAAAEKELAAFATVVKQHFGSEEAYQACEDWLRELAFSDCFAPEAIPDFRQLTVVAANRLVLRLRKLHSRRQLFVSVALRHCLTMIPDGLKHNHACHETKRTQQPEGRTVCLQITEH